MGTKPSYRELEQEVHRLRERARAHRELEGQLTEEVTRWRMLFDHSRDGIVILDGNGKVFEANRKFAQMLGYSMPEVLQLHVWEWDALIEKEQVAGMIQSVDASGDFFTTKHRRKDGVVIDVEISTNGIVFHGAKHVLCICRNVTERKQAEAEMTALVVELRAAFAEIRTLHGILPICAFCKKVRTDEGSWQQIETYVKANSNAEFSHGFCPECARKHYPELDEADA